MFEGASHDRCTTISVADNNITENRRSYQLVLEIGPRNVPVLMYPKTIPIIVVDNDGQGKGNYS